VNRRTMTFLCAEDIALADCRMEPEAATKKVHEE
jgi:hypothetical protein